MAQDTTATRVAQRWLRTAGGFTVPLLHKTVTTRMIANALKKSGEFDLDFFDLRNIQWDTVDQAKFPPHPYQAGFERTWRIFPKGEFGNRESEYVWGTVFVGMAPGNDGTPVGAHIYIKV
jgi:hypothetical protein